MKKSIVILLLVLLTGCSTNKHEEDCNKYSIVSKGLKDDLVYREDANDDELLSEPFIKLDVGPSLGYDYELIRTWTGREWCDHKLGPNKSDLGCIEWLRKDIIRACER